MPGQSARENGKKGGRPKGTKGTPFKWQSTISKEQAREGVRQAVMKHMDRMIRSQVAHSIGIGHLYTRDKTGKFTKVESAEQVDKLLIEGVEDRDYWIFTKDPSVQAFTDLMNRALDKPAEQMKVTGGDGGPVIHEMRWQRPASKS